MIWRLKDSMLFSRCRWDNSDACLISCLTRMFQFSFLGLGWLVAHEMWRFINPSTDTDLSLTSLSDFLLDDQTGLTGATINAGYVSVAESLRLQPSFTWKYSGHRHHPRLPGPVSAGEPFNSNWEEGRPRPQVTGREADLSGGGRIAEPPLQDRLSHSDSHQCYAGKMEIWKTKTSSNLSYFFFSTFPSCRSGSSWIY